MPVRVSCPHCRTPCLVADQHQGVPVQCGRCRRTFTTRADLRATMRLDPAALRVRLELGAASTRPGRADSFLVQHLVTSNLEERHELAVLIAADEPLVIAEAAPALAPLPPAFLAGSLRDAAAVLDPLAAACKNLGSILTLAVILDGQVALSMLGEGQSYLHSRGQVARLKAPSLRLFPGDWLVLTSTNQPPSFDAALQAEITARCSAAALAQRLVQHAAPDTGAILVVRGT